MSWPLRDSLHLIDTLDTFRRQPTPAEMVDQLHRLTAQDEPVSEALAQAVAEHVVTHPEQPVAGMWDRPHTLEEWAEAKRLADRAVLKTARACKFYGRWTFMFIPVASALGVWAGQMVSDQQNSGLMSFQFGLSGFAFGAWICAGGLSLFHNGGGKTLRTQRASEAVDHREDLEPMAMTVSAEQAKQWIKVPGLAACVTWATDAAVPFLRLDWRQANARLAAHHAQEKERREAILAAEKIKQAPALARRAAEEERQAKILALADFQEARRLLRTAAVSEQTRAF
jgi:hypothetical protein